MGLSLSVLIALVLILPGAAFVFGLTRLYSPKSPSTMLDEHVSVGLALLVLATLLIHSTWYSVIAASMAQFGWPRPDVSQLFALLGGDVTSELGLASLSSLRDYPARIAWYFISVTALAWIAGKSLNRQIRKKESASWHDLLRPDGVEFVWLTTDVELGDQCFLFAGPVKQFSIAKDGSLERVVLAYAVKKPLNQGIDSEGVIVTDGWTEVPGEFLVLQMVEARTINVDYFFPDEPTASAEATSGNDDPAAPVAAIPKPAAQCSLSFGGFGSFPGAIVSLLRI